jgi:His-Xaa-Ser system radical SAM maturase HxsC
MLTLKGIPKNMRKPLLGRVCFSESDKEGKQKTILVNPGITKKALDGYMAVICSDAELRSETKSLRMPVVYDIKGLELLSEGDVVEISPNGVISVLYQINSRHNVIFVTSKCDCNCIMCPQPIDNNEGNLTELNLRLISLMSTSTEVIALTGGEPAAIGNDLVKLILACRDLLPQTALLLLTNGRRFSDFEYTHFLSSLRHPNMMLGIPLYGDNNIEHDRIMGLKGAFDQTIRGILNLASFKHQIEIRTVIQRLTFDKLLRISEFIYRNLTFVKHIAFMGLEPIDRARKNIELLWVEPEEFVPHLEESIHYLIQRGMNASIYNIPVCLLPEYLWEYAQKSISDWKNSFDSKCFGCSVKEQCSGMFDSGIDIYTKYLKPIY